MTKVLKMLGSAAVLGVVLLGLMSAVNVSTVAAQSPPNPPSRIVGSVKIDGANAPANSVVEAKIGTVGCGVTNTFSSGSESRYALDVQAATAGSTACGTDGATITFYVNGIKANETGTWQNYALGTVNLTVTTTPTAAPKPPVTGNTAGVAGETAAIWLFAVLGLGALAFDVGGAAVARRGR